MELNTKNYTVELLNIKNDIYEFLFMLSTGDNVAYIDYNIKNKEIEKISFNVLKDVDEDFTDRVLDLEDKIKNIIEILIDIEDIQ